MNYIITLFIISICFSLFAGDDMDASYDTYLQFRRLTEVISNVKRYYVREVSISNIIDAAIFGMLTQLDPYSCYLTAADYKKLIDDTTGSYGGIGMTIGIKDGMLTVIAPMENTPAFRAGIQAGDIIEEIDNVKTSNIPLDEAVKRLRGEPGSVVTLKIRRISENKTFSIKLEREEIHIPSIKWKLLKDNIGYIKINQFEFQTARELRNVLRQLSTNGVNGIVMDIRDNPGGILQSAIAVASLFLKKGEEIVKIQGKNPEDTHVYKCVFTGEFVELPLVVLINKGTASAGEILVGALKDNNRAIVIGDTTFGKASVQTILPLKSDPEAGIKLTTAYYYTPSGNLIHERGVEPHIRVKVDPEEWNRILKKRMIEELSLVVNPDEFGQLKEVRDLALERAIDIIKATRIYLENFIKK